MTLVRVGLPDSERRLTLKDSWWYSVQPKHENNLAFDP